MQTFKFSLCFPDRVVRAEVGLEFRNKKVVVGEPRGFVRFKESGFETIKCRAFEVGKDVVDLRRIILEEVFLVPEVQLTLQQECMKLLGVTSRNTLDRADSSHAVHVTSRTRHHLPASSGHLGPIPRAWNLSPRSVALFGPYTCICFLSHFVSIRLICL